MLVGPTATALSALATSALRLQWPTVLSDTFDSNDNLWPVSPAVSNLGAAHWAVDTGVYILDLRSESGIFVRSTPERTDPVSDFQLQVDVAQVGGSDQGTYGVVFRDDGTNYYYVRIDNSGAVFISLRYQGAWKSILQASSPAVRPGVRNRLVVDVVGTQFDLFVNGQFAAEASDGTLRSGRSGVAADLGPRLSTTVEFDNFEVRVPPEVAVIRQQTTTAQAVRASATAQSAQATATARAQWPVVISDTFNSNNNAWPVGKVSDNFGALDRHIADGKYRWQAHTDQGVLWRYRPRQSIGFDFSVAVDALLISGTARTRYGIAFRDDGINYYVFEVSDNQHYQLSVRNARSWTTIIPSAQSAAIRPGEVNRVGVSVDGSHMQFFINDQRVDQVNDSILGSGRVGVTLELVQAGDDAVVEFKNFELRAPSVRVATETPQPATATAQASQATAQSQTATANATATVEARQAQAAHTQWPLVFSDTFIANTRGWPMDGSTPEFGAMQATLGGNVYRWHAKALKNATWAEAPQVTAISNLALTVDTRLSGSSSAQMGLVFRKFEGDYYLFEIRDDRTWRFSRHISGGSTVQIISSYSGSVQSGMTNRLTVVAEGSHFTLYVNGDMVGQADDDHLGSGAVGLSMTLDAGDEATFDFAHFELRAPP